MPSIRYHLKLEEVLPTDPPVRPKHEGTREGGKLVLRIPFQNLASGEEVEFQVPEDASAGEIEIVWDVTGSDDQR
ncbi:MAG: hypothetical protein ACRDPZ_09630 [Gaiellaceae bacterium]